MSVHIVKFGDIGGRGLSDAEMDYRFKVARAMGAPTITREIPDPKNIPGWWRRRASASRRSPTSGA